jgi:lysophospholipid acyltransferase (LPLAT)-like uncharacterized protein
MDSRELRFRAVGLLGWGVLGAYFPLVRCTRVGAEHFEQFRRRGEPVVFVFWHGQLLPLVHYHRNEGIVVLVSDHADGEYITRVILHHGFGAARGSSTRGGVKGLKGVLRAIKAGKDLAFTPDGPTCVQVWSPHGCAALRCSRDFRLCGGRQSMVPEQLGPFYDSQTSVFAPDSLRGAPMGAQGGLRGRSEGDRA